MKKFFKYLSLLLVCISLGIGCYMGYTYLHEQNVAKEINAISHDATNEASLEEGFDPATDFKVDWDYLASINSDVIAWLYVPGTTISYPILQERTQGTYYYINHNYYGAYSELGSVFTPYVDDPTNSNNELLLFAHNSFGWYGNVYFTDLADYYANVDTAASYQYAYVYYPNGDVEQYQNWAGHHTTVNNPVYTLPQEKDSEFYSQTLDYTRRNATYTSGDAPTADTKTLVLSTCEELRSHSNYRFYASFKWVKTTNQNTTTD